MIPSPSPPSLLPIAGGTLTGVIPYVKYPDGTPVAGKHVYIDIDAGDDKDKFSYFKDSDRAARGADPAHARRGLRGLR